MSAFELVHQLPCADLAAQTQLDAAAGTAPAAAPVPCPFLACHDTSFGRGLEHPAVLRGVGRRQTDDGRVQLIDGRDTCNVVTSGPRHVGPFDLVAAAADGRARHGLLERRGVVVVAPEMLVLALVALVVPRLVVVVVERVVAEAVVARVVDVEAASAFAECRALGAARGQASGAAAMWCVRSARSSRWGARPQGDFLAPVCICSGGFGVVVGAGFLELELLS